jgi:hypothetical protein
VHNEELHSLILTKYYWINPLKKHRRGHTTHMEEIRNVYRISVEKCEERVHYEDVRMG